MKIENINNTKRILIHGGLGNQLFQFSFAKYLQTKGFIVKLDISFFKFKQSHKGYRLDQLISDKLTLESNLDLMLSRISLIILTIKHRFITSSGILKRIYSYLFYNDKTYVEEYFTDFINIDNVSPKDLFFGYFQNKLFLTDDLCQIFNESKLNIQTNSEVNSLINLLKEIESVSVHVRRGDYLGTNLDVISLDYYVQAVKIMRELLSNPKFVFFSDDTEFAKSLTDELISNQTLLESELFECNLSVRKSEIDDFLLMNSCRNNIITNSTFSWWAAYLNLNEKKNVIMPRNWIKNIHYNPKALQIEGWIIL